MMNSVRLVLVVAACALLGGCASSTERAESKSLSSAKTFREELGQMPSRVDATMAKLYDTTSGGNTDRAASFNQFRDQLRYLQTDASRVGAEADTAKRDRETYFREWNRQAMKSDPAKRGQMNATAADRNASYNNALSYLSGAKDNYRDLVANLTDIEKTLGSNLGNYTSPAVQNGISTAMVKANNLKDYIARLSEHIDTAIAGVGE